MGCEMNKSVLAAVCTGALLLSTQAMARVDVFLGLPGVVVAPPPPAYYPPPVIYEPAPRYVPPPRGWYDDRWERRQYRNWLREQRERERWERRQWERAHGWRDRDDD